ncbi:hypothetical protein LLEC1_01267 [Akanthomyces lecanii]|uniref:Uncharacterized protein n=1 Tax=Cordyceps confragosa TaxID=2714763 RepID=A0A179I3C9_CORDF|nr:hypothetical protein LLEC1_01267 [Akanthomyces lecanii]
MTMATTAGENTFHGFGTRPAGTVTTITSENNYRRPAGRSNRHSLLPFRHVSSSSEEDGGNSANHRRSGRFLPGLKLLDRTAKTRAQSSGSERRDHHHHQHHVRSQASQGSGSGTDASSPSGSTTSSPAMTKEEFEALPPTIRRKYFSTLERLRFAQDSEPEDSDTTPSASLDNLPKLHPNINPATTTTTTTSPSAAAASTGRSLQDKHQPVRLTVLSKLPSESIPLASSPQRPRSALIRLHSSPASDRHTTCKLGLGIIHKFDDYHLSYRHSVILDATDEALIKRGKRHTHITACQSHGHLYRTASFDHLSLRMHPHTVDAAWMDGRLKETEDSLYDSFRWLEDDADLDLRLDLDDYHLGLRQEVVNRKSRSASIRRKLSISSKVTFGRASSTLSRPTTKNASTPFGGSVLSLQNTSGNGHVRRRSRALSLMSAKQPPPEVTGAASSSSPPAMDPAAHYQDPEARMKLRVYLASPHKFDEAVEFGFPSTEQPNSPTSPPKRVDSLLRNTDRGAGLRMQTLVEDKRCSLYSDETTATESDSPRTPDTLERPSEPFDAAVIVPADHDEDCEPPKVDYAQAHAYSREMTLRMTLTRPDLRANEDQMYGWQKNRATASDGLGSPLGPRTEDDMKKDSIERELAAIDQENMLYPEQSSMKRFWNRVRRT